MTASDELWLELSVPKQEAIEVDMVPRAELGRGPDAINARISVGLPVVVPIPADELDAGVLAPYVAREAGHLSYSLLSLALTFYPIDPFAEAAVGVRLFHEGAGNLPMPVAWSLVPERATAPIKVTSAVSISAMLSIVAPTVSRTAEKSGESPLVIAYGLRQSDPEWRFTPSRTYPLVGAHTLTVVVQHPTQASTFAEVLISGAVRRRAMGIVRLRADLPAQFSRILIFDHRTVR